MLYAALFALMMQSNAPSPLPSAEQIEKILADRIDVKRRGVGIVVGVVSPEGRRVVAHGRSAAGGKAVDENTVFEIGSVTKVFTALALVDAERRGEVKREDSLGKWIGPQLRSPDFGAAAVTLEQLANHTSGLPRLPSNLKPANEDDPYADYSAPLLHAFLEKHKLRRAPGAKYEYSNLGAGLLGHVLSLRTALSYEELLRQRLLRPLGMKNTAIRLSPALQSRLAPGHAGGLETTANWQMDALAGAGALRSTASDLIRFLEAALGLKRTKLQPVFAAALAPRQPAGKDMEIALGWHVRKQQGRELVWHNGGTGGYRSFLGYNAATRVGVVVLSNASVEPGVDDIGFHLLDGSLALAKVEPLRIRQAIPLPAADAARYTGHYPLTPAFALDVFVRNGQLFLQATQQAALPLYAESATDFFLKAVDAQIIFTVDEAGRATGLSLVQGGQRTTAQRSGDAAAR